MNAKLNFSISVLCMFLSGLAFGQTPETDNITAVKLTAAVGQQYFNKISIEAFTVDKNNVLRSAKGYKIAYFATEKKIAILPKAMKLVSAQLSAPGFDVSEVPGGTMFCMCNQADDDCKISPRILDKTLVFSCGGSCGCGSFIIYDTSDPVLGYQTAGGGWFNY
jgi:hypothetical protein